MKKWSSEKNVSPKKLSPTKSVPFSDVNKCRVISVPNADVNVPKFFRNEKKDVERYEIDG